MSALGIVLFAVAVVLILARPFMTTFILRRHPDKATSRSFLSYRLAAVTAGIGAVVLIVWLVSNGGLR